jgi:preprotein translocase subunit SecD
VAVRHRIGTGTKAGSPGLLLRSALVAVWIVATASPVASEPIAIDVVSALPAFDQRTNQPVVTLKMTPASARLFAKLTAENVGRKVEVRVDGRTLMAPVIREPILGGTLQISGPYTVEQVRDLANRLSTGKTKVELEIVNR